MRFCVVQKPIPLFRQYRIAWIEIPSGNGKSELLAAFYSYPKWRANLYLNWTRGPHNLRWTMHYKDGPTNIIAGQPDLKQKDEITTFNQALLQLPTRVPRTGVARTDGFSGADIHFDGPETRKLGQRYAEVMLEVQAK